MLKSRRCRTLLHRPSMWTRSTQTVSRLLFAGTLLPMSQTEELKSSCTAFSGTKAQDSLITSLSQLVLLPTQSQALTLDSSLATLTSSGTEPRTNMAGDLTPKSQHSIQHRYQRRLVQSSRRLKTISLRLSGTTLTMALQQLRLTKFKSSSTMATSTRKATTVMVHKPQLYLTDIASSRL